MLSGKQFSGIKKKQDKNAVKTLVFICCNVIFLYIWKTGGQWPHSCNPYPFLSMVWTRSLNLSLTPEEKNPSTWSPERLSLQAKTEAMGGQSHILILGQRTWIQYEPGNCSIDCRASPRSVLGFNGPPSARQSHIKKMLNCNFQTSAVHWRHIIGMSEETDFELLASWADGYHCPAKVYVFMSYVLITSFRVMVDTDQLYIQYHNYSKSWCNVPHIAA